MSLSSSLFTGTSGLKNMGNALQVTGNNIANLNTVGFKKGRATFADTLYENVATQGGTDQVGRGMAVGDVSQNFSQGSFESTGNTTDLSIGGDGFFIMRQSDSENTFYTRAGNFYFNELGELVNPEGYIVQGWELDEDTGDNTGSITDIILDAYTSSPEETTTVTAITNLDADAESQSVVLSNSWDSGDDTDISSSNYEYQTVVQVYDSLGSTHDVSIYYDKVSGSNWEYIITSNPEEDNRNLVQNTDSMGLLARGTISFSESSGDITDLTMEKFTGLLGNFTAEGVNGVDDIQYYIEDYDTLSLDGYGFEFEYDGSEWEFVDQTDDGVITSADKPENYGSASVVYSDANNVWLSLTSENDDPDIRIELSSSAVSGDTFGFDINENDDVHVQNVESLSYSGELTSENTTLTINDSSVMTHDESDIGILWNPTEEQWYWSNPVVASSAGSLVSGIEMAGTPQTAETFVTIENAEDLDMMSSDITLMVNNRTDDWDWNMPLKEEDFASEVFNFSPTNDPALTIVSVGSQGAVASTDNAGAETTITLTWNGTTWASDAGGGETVVTVDAGNSDETQVQFSLWQDDGIGASTGASTVLYSFGSDLTAVGGQTITFQIDPTPPEEYPNAVLSSVGAPAEGIGIDFDNDSTVDLFLDPASDGSTTAVGGLSVVFDVNPDTPPVNYSDATLTGDASQVTIDLDGSGNSSDKDDIVFTFDDDLSAGATNTDPYDDRSVISFDILGSTAWTSVDTDDMTSDGYFAFTADFLGGDFGTTEMEIALDIGTVYDGNNFVNDSLSTTQYSKSSSTVYQDADGYSAGDLQGVDVASDGVMTGIYSNGELIPLFRVGLAKFLNNYGLLTEGGNMYSETNDSGSAITNIPGENGLGTLSPNSLEMSNVDIAEEFVSLITNQRGFQANSKTITTVDEMMQTVIQMK